MSTTFKPKSEVRRLRVLIADDVKETRRSARLMLSLIPAVEVVAAAQNGREAVQLASQHDPDIVLIDINMPEMDGLSAVRTMLRQNPDLACIMMSAQGDSATLQEAISSGVKGYLVKPFTTEELVTEIRRVMGSVKGARKDVAELAQLRRQRDALLLDLATEYAKARRTDDKAREVFEMLAADPQCEPQWLMALAMIYLVRRRWRELKQIAERLDQLPAAGGRS